MKLHTLKDLFVDELRDLYNAENQIIKALPKMIKAASSSELKKAFQEHLEQTKTHAERLEQIFDRFNLGHKGKKCKGIEGIIDEGNEMIGEADEPAVGDAALIGAAQRVEHYEMAGYGCARTYADTLGDREAANLLQQTLAEEKETDEKLTRIAENVVNMQAVGAGNQRA
ncbi:MAG TPA: ferritin-like domain-containing protein [Gemmataceae bacterium]|nr:ferritin-like domain-containing protein [Gemmataceae bacterium]